MAYNANAPADEQTIAAGPADIRTNQEALRTGGIVNAGTVNGLTTGNATGNIPVANGTLCKNLNAEMLGGLLAAAFALVGHTHSVATGSSNGFMSNTDFTKLAGIATGAEVNQNTFSNVLVGSTTIQADSKMDTLEMVAGANIAITADATNDRLTISITGAVPVANGGTGATTVAGALTNLGLTATAAELNYTDGVTSNIQTQLNAKAPTSHASTATTYGVSTASNYGHAMASSATPLVAGTAAVGTDNGKFAREGHVHPAQTTVTGSSGSCSGNAATATKLANARNISLTGAITGNVSTDLSGDVSITTSDGTLGNTYDAGHTFDANGYQKLSNGLILQWGIGTTNASWNTKIPFNVTFPSACFNVQITLFDVNGTPTSAAYENIVGVKYKDTTGFYGGGYAAGTTFFWFAIGC